VKNYSIFLLLIFLSIDLNAQKIEFSEISPNKKIFIKDIKIYGNEYLKEDEIISMLNIKPEKSVFIYDIINGISGLLNTGFFKNIYYSFEKHGGEYVLEIKVEENERLAEIQVVDNKLLNLLILSEKLKKNNVVINRPISIPCIEKSIEEFNVYNQTYGIFTYIIDFQIVYRNITKEDIVSNPENKEEAVLIIKIESIPLIKISEIKLIGTNVSYDELLNYARLRNNQWVDSSDLFFSYKRLKKLGFFKEIYFKLVKKPYEGPYYDLVVKLDELELREITTTLTAPKNVGIITSVEYYDISLFNTLQRFKIGAGWELSLSKPVFILEYTNPFFGEGIFTDMTFTKEDSVESINETDLNKLTENYSLRLTGGVNIWENLFFYLFFQGDYKISYIVDKKYDRVPERPKTKDTLTSSGIIVLWDDIDNSFFITQGIKLGLESQVFFGEKISNRIGTNIEVYIPAPMFNLIFAVTNRSYILLSSKDDKTSLSLDKRMRTNVQVIENLENNITKATTYTSIEFRFPVKILIDDLSFIVFGEAGGAWKDYKSIKLENVLYGFGLGFRLSPKKHYSSFLFQFPAGIYVGYRTGEKYPAVAGPISHRDDYYYINLIAGF